MRFMIIIKSDARSEAGALPDHEMLVAMGQFNEELVAAGVMLGGEGLKPTSQGARVRFEDGQLNVTDGPFTETKELVAGYWLWKCKDLQEAIAWVKRAPNSTAHEIEIRPLYELDDFGDELTPELRAQEERLWAASGADKVR